MKNIVFFDVDGTIWDEQMRIPAQTRKSIKKLRENGNLAFVCTGRSRANITAPELLELGFDGIVCACGCHIEMDGKMLRDQILPYEMIEYANKTLSRARMPVVFEGPEYCWFNEEDFDGDPYIDYLLEVMGDTARRLEDLTPYARVNKFSVDIMPYSDLKSVQEAFLGRMDIILHGAVVAEFVPPGMSKAEGIREVLGRLGIPKENSFALGDGNNDLEMIDYVGHGIAMGNAAESLKERAEFVTKDLRENGLTYALQHYGLI